MLETDVNREVDLDREIKASGYFEEEDEQLIERVGQQLLDNACGDNEQIQSDEEFDEEQFEVDPES